jgi:hypothetical protein
MRDLLALLALANDLADARADLRDPDAALLLARARRLVKRAALRLAKGQWAAQAPVPSPERRAPVILPIGPSPAGRASGPHSRTNGHA